MIRLGRRVSINQTHQLGKDLILATQCTQCKNYTTNNYNHILNSTHSCYLLTQWQLYGKYNTLLFTTSNEFQFFAQRQSPGRNDEHNLLDEDEPSKLGMKQIKANFYRSDAEYRCRHSISRELGNLRGCIYSIPDVAVKHSQEPSIVRLAARLGSYRCEIECRGLFSSLTEAKVMSRRVASGAGVHG